MVVFKVYRPHLFILTPSMVRLTSIVLFLSLILVSNIMEFNFYYRSSSDLVKIYYYFRFAILCFSKCDLSFSARFRAFDFFSYY